MAQMPSAMAAEPYSSDWALSERLAASCSARADTATAASQDIAVSA